MSNSTKAIIVAIIAAIAISGIYVLTKSGFNQNQPNQITSSSSVSSSSQTISSPKSVLSSSSQLISSSFQAETSKVMEAPKVESTVKVEEPTIDRGSNPNPVQDIPNVTKLSTDKSIYWQYIKDYLACPTKFYQPLNGGYIYDGLDQYQYLCIPQSEIDKCNSTKNKFRDGAVKGKYYCDVYSDKPGGPYTSELDFYGQYFKDVDLKSPSIKGYYSIPKYLIPNNSFPKISFAAIPIESFSKEDQAYIAKNFPLK